MKQRILWLDAMKGIGIILVMLSHLGIPLPFGEYLIDGYIPLFFVAAGFTYRPSEDIIETMKKKGLRLMLPYFFYGLFATLLFNVIKWQGSDHLCRELFGLLYGKFSLLAYPDYGSSQILASAAGPLWFLPAMFISFVFISIWEKTSRNRWFIIGACLLQIAILFQPYLFPWSMESFLFFSFFIIIGSRYKNIFFLENRVWVFIFVLSLYCVIVYFNSYDNLSIGQWGNYGILSFPFCIIIGLLYSFIVAYMCRMLERTILIKTLAYVGRKSLRLMCIHMPVGTFTFMILMKFGLWPSIYELGYIYQFAVVFAIAILLEKFFKCYSEKIAIFKYL